MERTPAFDQHVRSTPPPAKVLRGLIGIGDEAPRQDPVFGQQHASPNPSPLVEHRQWRPSWPLATEGAEERTPEKRDERPSQTGRGAVFGGFVGASFMQALQSLPASEVDEKTAAAIAFLDGLIQEVEARGYDKQQAKHLKDVQKSLDSHRRRGSKLFR